MKRKIHGGAVLLFFFLPMTIKGLNKALDQRDWVTSLLVVVSATMLIVGVYQGQKKQESSL